jgi:hypothetical protein
VVVGGVIKDYQAASSRRFDTLVELMEKKSVL